ncbi:murein hydrolase activator EnvC family protein [Deferribacteres bacterium DY0037]
MKFNILILSVFIALNLFAGTISDEIVRSDNYLRQVQKMIKEEQQAIKELRDEKKKKAKQLKKAEIELQYQKSISKKLESKLRNAEKDLSFINFQRTKLSNRQEELKDSIRAANFYLSGAGETDLLEAIILSDEIAEVAAGMQIISRVNERLFEMAKELEQNQKKLDETEVKLRHKQKEISMTLQDKNASLKEYQSKKILVNQLYRIAAEDEKIKNEYVSMLRDQQNELEQKIKEMELTQIKQGEERKFDGLDKNFKHMRKKLQWPIKGEITETFGTKKIQGFRGVIHKKGVKIKPDESHVSSVYDGVVMHTDTAWGLGWFVIVEHAGGYYTLYANLNSITVKQNQKVHTGEILGTIDIDHEANTPYLYFEIRIHDKAVDPQKWLTS